MDENQIRINIQNTVTPGHLEKIEKKIKTLLENEKVKAKIDDLVLGNTFYTKVDENVIYEFGEIDFQTLEKSYPNLLATVQYNFPELSRQDIVKICNLTIGTCGDCRNNKSGCNCYNENYSKLHI